MREIRVLMNGVTGRMGTNQHLIRSILAIRAQGGVPSRSGEMIVPVPVLVGRNAKKLDALVASLADKHGPIEWTTDLDGALADPANEIYFDSTLTQIREEGRPQGDRRGQAGLLREADGNRHRDGRCPRPGGARRGGQERRRSGQALAPGTSQTQVSYRYRFLRSNPLGPG
jgi:hypothetical protein